jgi:tetratricopeptide (TPR) repeat protein
MQKKSQPEYPYLYSVQGFRYCDLLLGKEKGTVREVRERAECYRRQQQFSLAWVDLNKALEIAGSRSMKLHLVDYHLEAARLCQDEGKTVEAKEHVKKAAEIIEETGYHRRDSEISS